MTTTQKINGKRGAEYGIMVEHEFARRINGSRTNTNISKTDVIEDIDKRHSVKNTRKSQHCRFLARSYNVVMNGEWDVFKLYIEARISKNLLEEYSACAKICDEMNDPTRGNQILQEVIAGKHGTANLMTIYDNRAERTNEDLSAPFRSFQIKDVLTLYNTKLIWKPKKGRKHWNVIAMLQGFRHIAMTISLGSPTRRLLLFTFCNVQKQADYWNDVISCRLIK